MNSSSEQQQTTAIRRTGEQDNDRDQQQCLKPAQGMAAVVQGSPHVAPKGEDCPLLWRPQAGDGNLLLAGHQVHLQCWGDSAGEGVVETGGGRPRGAATAAAGGGGCGGGAGDHPANTHLRARQLLIRALKLHIAGWRGGGCRGSGGDVGEAPQATRCDAGAHKPANLMARAIQGSCRQPGRRPERGLALAGGH